MTFMRNLKELSTETRTTNGDVAYSSTLNYNLDLFGASVADTTYLYQTFIKALREDKLTAIKNLLFLRDIYSGQGRRESFRALLYKLAIDYPKDVVTLLPYIVEYGRWDDIFDLIHTSIRKEVIQFISKQLKADLKSKKEVSLLGKWLPTESSKNEEVKLMARTFAKLLYDGNFKAYRKDVASLRKRIKIVETNLTNKDYTFRYENLPSKALLKYTNAFETRDLKRYNEYLESLEDKKNSNKLGEKASKLYPHEIVIKTLRESEKLGNALWSSLPLTETKHKIIVVRDGSGSMYISIPKTNASCYDVCNALSIYASERLNGEFKDKFITFSETPKLVDLSSGKDLSEKLDILNYYSEVANTNIEATYRLLFQAMKNAKPEDRPDMVLILSDMQFDSGTSNAGKGTFKKFKEKFEKADMEMPKMVYWNLYVSGKPTFTTRDEDVLLVSGFSKNVFDLLANEDTTSLSGVGLMMKALSKYDFLDELINKD